MGSAGQVSGQPWSTPSRDPLFVEPYQPPAPPAPPTFRPGYASLPPPSAPHAYSATSQYPQQPGYASAGYAPEGHELPAYGQPGYGATVASGQLGYGQPPPGYGGQPGYDPAPRRSNVPFVAVIVAVAVLLCGGAVTAGALVVNNIANRAEEAVKPITNPTLPAIPTEAPDLPGLPTGLPTLPTDLPSLPAGLPNLPGGTGTKITVRYEVTGDGPAEILYTKKLGETPERVDSAKLPWKITTKMEGTAFVSVTAVRLGTDAGSISCRALVDGKEVARRTHEGSYATVSCNQLIID
jgi:hypothetical protein